MMVLVTGGSGSGKSAYAECRALELYRADSSASRLYETADTEKEKNASRLCEAADAGKAKPASQLCEAADGGKVYVTTDGKKVQETADTGKERTARRLIYLATMYNDGSDPETLARIRRHREMREGKGFVTIEQPSYIADTDVRAEDTVLLEDLPNLLANELFGNECRSVERVAEDLKTLSGKCGNLVIVTGIIDCDGAEYDEYTNRYIRDLSALHRTVAAEADEVTEVVAGIPVAVKRSRNRKVM